MSESQQSQFVGHNLSNKTLFPSHGGPFYVLCTLLCIFAHNVADMRHYLFAMTLKKGIMTQ